MKLEEALQTAMEELYDAVEILRRNNKGYHAHIEVQCNRLLTARNVLCKELEECDESYDQTELELCDRCGWKTLIPDDVCLNCNKREWIGLENKDRFWVVDEWQQLTRSVKDTEFNKALRLCKMLEAKLKEKNT